MSLSGIWTSKGIDKLAAQTAGGPTLTIDKIALGDGGGIVPAVVPSQAALLKEVWRGLVNAVLIEPDTPNAVTVEAVIPYSVGGFYIREWGIYDTDGDLIAVGPHAEFYKPLLAEGSGAELLERIQLPLANAGQVNLTISSEALATRKYADQTAIAKAREEVARHDGDVTAHGSVAKALENHIQDLENPHKTPLPPLATVQRPGLMYPDGCTCMVNDTGMLSGLTGAQWRAVINYTQPIAVLGLDNKIYLWRAPSGPAIDTVGAKQPGTEGSGDYWLDYAASIFTHMMDYRLCQYDWFEDDMPRAGFYSCLGGVVPNFAAKYPKAAAYFETPYGQKRLVTQAQYDALHVATWHTKADGTKVGWNGIGGVAKFVWDKTADTLRLPDLAGMTPEQVGYMDSLGVGAVRGDAIRNHIGLLGINTREDNTGGASGVFYAANMSGGRSGYVQGSSAPDVVRFDPSRVVPTSPRNHGPRWISDARVYLGLPAS